MKKRIYSPPSIRLVGLSQHLLTVISAAKGGSGVGEDSYTTTKKSWVTENDELSRESNDYWDDWEDEE